MTISEQLQEIVDMMCNDYCRYPREWNEEEQGELCESEICANCPLNRI